MISANTERRAVPLQHLSQSVYRPVVVNGFKTDYDIAMLLDVGKLPKTKAICRNVD